MTSMLIFSAAAILFLLIALIATYKKWMVVAFFWLLVAIFFGAGALRSAVGDVGYGRVPEEVEPLSKRLKTGVFYQVIGSARDGTNEVVFVKPYDGDKRMPELYAIRVMVGSLPPKYFTMIDDKPVAIVVDKKPKSLK